MNLFFALLFTCCILSCQSKAPSNYKGLTQPKYELVTAWPQAGRDYKLGQPTGIGIDNDDHIFVFHRAGRIWTTPFPDSLISENTVFELDKETGKILNSWGANYFIMPHGLAVDKENNIWLTDVGLHQIFKFSHEGELLMKLGVAKVAGNDSLHFDLPTDIAIADDGTFYVSDGYGNSRIVKFSSTGKYIKSWGTYGSKPGEFVIPHGIAIGRNNTIYVADRQNNRIQLFDTSGTFIREIENDEDVQQLPSIAIDDAGSVFAIDYDPTKKIDSTVTGSTIIEFDSSHLVKDRFGATGTSDRTTCWFHDLAIDSEGNIYVGDIIGIKILKFRLQK